MKFYDEGGDFDNPEKSSLLDRIRRRSDDREALVDFMTHGLTDCRVEKQRAAFDHPSLPLPNSVSGDLPAVGAGGLGSYS